MSHFEIRLRWAGNVVRMPDDRLPKALMCAELTEGQRKQGGQKRRYRDVLKCHLKAADIDTDSWKSKASDRVTWRKKVHDAVKKTVEWKRKEKYLEGWRKRHPISTTLCHHHNRWEVNDDDEISCDVIFDRLRTSAE